MLEVLGVPTVPTRGAQTCQAPAGEAAEGAVEEYPLAQMTHWAGGEDLTARAEQVPAPPISLLLTPARQTLHQLSPRRQHSPGVEKICVDLDIGAVGVDMSRVE